MESVGQGDEAKERKSGGMSEQRRDRVRLEISREAARLFWENGVDGTTGEMIADAVGLSVRTIWRYFRNKESCAEPVLAQDVEEFLGVLRSWPREVSLEDHLVEWATNRSRDSDQQSYDLAVMRMMALSDTEPSLRTAWLMACDQAERELVGILADRLRLPKDELEVRLHAAAVISVVRVIDEYMSAALLAGEDSSSIGNSLQRIASAVRAATGGVVGDSVEP